MYCTLSEPDLRSAERGKETMLCTAHYLSPICGLLREEKPSDICSVIACWSTCQQANKHDEVASSLFYIVISICGIIDLLLSNRNKSAVHEKMELLRLTRKQHPKI